MIPLPPLHSYNFERRLKKVIGTKKKVIFDILCENYRTFYYENSDLKYSSTALNNEKF